MVLTFLMTLLMCEGKFISCFDINLIDKGIIYEMLEL